MTPLLFALAPGLYRVLFGTGDQLLTLDALFVSVEDLILADVHEALFLKGALRRSLVP